MSYTYSSGNTVFSEGVAFEYNGVAYPSNWLTLASNSDLIAVGITKEDAPAFVPTANDIVDKQTYLVGRAFDYMYNTVLETATVNSVSTYANTSYSYGIDKVTRENIQGTVTAMTAGITFPDPIDWTPKGYVDPVQLSHTDLVVASGAILLKVNEIYGVYFVHKANILMSDDWTYLISYDYTTGYANT